jgi:hypothetical protein
MVQIKTKDDILIEGIQKATTHSKIKDYQIYKIVKILLISVNW